MTEQLGKVMKGEKSLLKKYEIPLDHLSFEYIEKCKERKELEKIVKILRSGEEGYFPQLQQCAEAHLKEIAPQSRTLRTEEPAETKFSLGSDKWNKIADEMAEWTSEMKNRDQSLQNSKSHMEELPRIRTMSPKMQQGGQQADGATKVKSVVPRDYSDWDKFDVDKEILKMDLEDERKREQIAKKKKQQEKEKKKNKNELDPIISAASNLSSVEKEFMATQEKDRGNECYNAGNYEEAVKCYTNSILLCPTPTAYNNRAMAQLKLQMYAEVIADCNEVLEAEPHNVKALHRRGVAHKNKDHHEQAYEDFSKILELEPENQVAKTLAEQMKEKLEPAVKSVRLSIEDEYDETKGFKFPEPRPNVPVNEWGLAKVMCRCNGTPAWVLQKPPKCRICERKRKVQQEEVKEMAKECDVMDSGVSNTSNYVCENALVNQWQGDEKGSGDMRDTEKVLQQVSGKEDTETSGEKAVQQIVSKSQPVITELSGSGDSIEDKDISSVSSNKATKLKVPTDKEEFLNEAKSVEAKKSKITLQNESRTAVNEDTNKVRGKQKSPVVNDGGDKQGRVQIANKYKKRSAIAKDEAKESEEFKEVSSQDIITSAFEFVQKWKEVDGDLSAHAEVLRSVSPSHLSSVIGNKLDEAMLNTMLMCLEKHFPPELVLEYLNSITHLPRFGIISCFLDSSRKEAIHRLLKRLESMGYPSIALQKAFQC